MLKMCVSVYKKCLETMQSHRELFLLEEKKTSKNR